MVRAGGRELLNLTRSSDGATCLHIACLSGHLNVVNYLVEADFDLNTPNSPESILLQVTRTGASPLHVACHNGHLHIVECLCSALNLDEITTTTWLLRCKLRMNSLGSGGESSRSSSSALASPMSPRVLSTPRPTTPRPNTQRQIAPKTPITPRLNCPIIHTPRPNTPRVNTPKPTTVGVGPQ